ncbi:hypothetical protein [Extensimonas vulgaris]|uniref:Uncharacterized protein n=1 Tax=Extensimonas vulgaris TaxID=1031594 RepID=A0A369ANN2_9BURK|nr:hypothetical protein [Extensimonas vulgaris]RCX10695.1 hypothetical protein DFR45_10296 [Extensimonas vulgaris]TWI41337.1 hypothetical protein IP95_00094 [Extensimonas vulgaris]TXD16806.1 hypothetical protein FUT63_02105 [Extensimonas vulgaris]
MAILPTDIKLLESQRMTDTTDGGGRMTSREIPDNVAGNLFPKISRIDSVYGRVNLRKFYMAVQTQNLDVYAGAHIGVFAPPANPNVNITLFTTGSDFDTRSDAQNRVEGYVIKGVKSRMKLFGDQIIGQKAILVYQKTTEPLPEIGETYLLSVEKSGYTPAEQYIRITDLKYEDREFTVGVGGGGETTFTRRIITLGLTNPLKQTFPGAEVTYLEDTGSPTIVRETNVADTARYYGIQPLTGSYTPGAMTIKAASMFAPLVPSTSRETAIGLASASGASIIVPCASPGNEIVFTPPTRQNSRYFPIGIDKHATTLQVDPSRITVDLTRKDNIFTVNDVYYKIIETTPLHIEYQNGGTWLNYAYNWYFKNPAVPVAQPAHTHAIPVTLGTQGLVQSLVCMPIPAPGSLILDYRSNGRWYRLVDDGTGAVADADGNTALGSGKLSFIDGSLLVTLGALPDVGSSILLSWGSFVHYDLLSNVSPTITPPTVRQTLAASDAANVVAPGTVTATWGSGLSVTDNGKGALTGSAGSGSINYATREVRLQFAALPAPNTVVQWAYNQVPPNATSPQIVTAASTQGNLQLNGIGGGSLKQGSVRIEALAAFPQSITATVVFCDDGNGKLIAQPLSSAVSNPFYRLPQSYGPNPAGTIDYVTGNAVIYPSTGYALYWDGTAWQQQFFTATWASNTATCYFSLTSDAASAATDSTTITQLQIDLTPYTANPVVPASLLFDACGRTYYDKQGTLYNQFDFSTGSGHPAGSIDYAAGVATLTEWVAASSPAFTLKAGLVKKGDYWVYDSSWRVPGSPLRPASLYVQVSSADGRLLAGSADQNGKITGPEMDGQVQQEVGVVNVRFGATVLDSSLTDAEKAEPWYNPANVDGTGHIWRPTRCMPETLRYSCVVLTQLPLDPALLGLDPVRLPRDGRVPIYRPADVVVVHNTKTDAVPTLSAGQVVTLSRSPVDVVMVIDAAGKKLNPSLYTADLDAGTLTMATPLDLTGYTAPYTVRHRIEEENLVSRTQIDGTLELSRPLTYAHDATSYVSSALVFGDLQARYTNLFDQQTWTGVWSDTLIGNAASATYDDLNHPIEVLNNGTVNERWRIDFTSATAFNITGEHLGIIATGNTSTDIAVINNLTGKPYFVLRAAGWGLGWAAGNQLRFNTLGATGSVWAARTILSGAAVTGDAFVVERRGDVD